MTSLDTQQVSTLPGPPPTPLIGRAGNMLWFGRDRIAGITRLYADYGEVVALVQNDTRRVFVFGPDYNRQVLNDLETFHHHYPMPLREPVLQRLGSGLLFMNGEEHRGCRRMLMPAFHKQQVISFYHAMITIVQRALDRWAPPISLDIAQEMQQITLEIVTNILFGLDQVVQDSQVGQGIRDWMKAFTKISTQLLPFDLPGLPYRHMLRLAYQLEATIRMLIQQHRTVGMAQSDVLSMLVRTQAESGGELSEAKLIGQITTLFLAGHETTANALTWTLFLLTQHPQIYADLIDELSLLGKDVPTLEQLESCSLLDQVIRESLRLLPPAIYNHRQVKADVALGQYILPAGSIVTYSPYITHRMPALYDQPTAFQPQRWETLTPSPYEYLPFGAGSRMCIGATFALLEMKTILALTLRQFRFALCTHARIDRQVLFTLSPKYGMPMEVILPNHHIPQQRARGNIREMVDLP